MIGKGLNEHRLSRSPFHGSQLTRKNRWGDKVFQWTPDFIRRFDKPEGLVMGYLETTYGPLDSLSIYVRTYTFFLCKRSGDPYRHVRFVMSTSGYRSRGKEVLYLLHHGRTEDLQSSPTYRSSHLPYI